MRRYGWKPDLPDQRDRFYRVARPIALPAELDLRPVQPPVFDQGQLGSCTGNAVASALEAQETAQGEGLVILSRLFIYYNTREMEGTAGEDAGAYIRDTIKSVARFGACPEQQWPYDISRFAARPPEQCYREAVNSRALRYERVPQNLTSIKTALMQARGIVLGISVYESFEAGTVARTGIVPMPGRKESMLGGHCVKLVGYCDEGLGGIPKRHFIGMNSWGTEWGMKGFFAIPYEYITNSNLADDLWVIQSVS
jgi:C1A family cysteine protease